MINHGPLPPQYSLAELDAQIQADMIKFGKERNDLAKLREHRGH